MTNFVYKIPVQTGTVGGVPVIANALAGAWENKIVKVQLLSSYTRAPDFSYPDPPKYNGIDFTAASQVIASGTTIAVYSDEAAALVTGGYANYV